MSIWAFVFLMLGSPGHPPAGPMSVGTQVIHAPVVYSAYDTESDLPSREYGLPDGDDEREGEEEDGSNAKAPRAALIHPVLDRPVAVCARIDLVNRGMSGLDISGRSLVLRC